MNARLQTALVIDDNIDACRICDLVLGSLGYQVTVTQDSVVAMDLLQRQDFDLLALDLQMPVMNGRTLLHKVRSMEMHKDMTVIVLTAEAHMATEDLDESADCVLQKPIDVAVLAQLARRLTKLPGTRPLSAEVTA